ncbi:MAG: ribosomal-processing cysteine protease Prp [Lachnospiraceae bacterium]|nr:ribosomal-processing cysteine protease Prp [Lachnospiraceae bacterium]
MTKITIKKTETGDYAGFTCEGHAGYADKGEDIICAAISILTINLENSLALLVKEPMEIVQDEESGLISVIFSQTPGEKSRLLIESYILGISEIFNKYGKKYVQLEFEEVI